MTQSSARPPAGAQTPIARRIAATIAAELAVGDDQVVAAVALMDEGATLPFIARYRKEMTGGLDDVQLRQLETRLHYLRELEDRRGTVLRSIQEQGKLTDELRTAIEQVQSRQQLEDLYLPYKPRRRTKAQTAREAGLEPLADALLADPAVAPEAAAAHYVKPAADGVDFSTAALALDGARDILSERWAEDAALVGALRDWLWNEGRLKSSLVEGKNPEDPEVSKFRDYFDYSEPIKDIPSHRALAVFRGRTQQIIDAKLEQPEAAASGQASSSASPPPTASPASTSTEPTAAERRIGAHVGWRHQGRAADDFLKRCVAWTWRVKLGPSTERDLFSRLREQAEATAITVFARNLRDLLLAAPAGPKSVMGLDPGVRTGVKVAVVDRTGRLVETATVFPHQPRKDWDGSLKKLNELCERHSVDLIAIGNGTASRETDKLVADLQKMRTQQTPPARPTQRVVVSEAGASVYSASEAASEEMPDVDVSLRGAASIARRLQDPLAELVKIEPKSIGVGQYQHDVNQFELSRTLDGVVEDCVNAVGVDLNTASVRLLSRVSGLSGGVARALVGWRDANGAFDDRQQLLKVPGIGARTFQLSAGFLRIRGGSNPIDMTGVHPETYGVVQKILEHVGKPVDQVMGNAEVLRALSPELFAGGEIGAITVQDILQELEKPGRDPRPGFRVARFNEGVETVADLKPGMVLEGTVSNVAAFGAFVDLGVHQDGLVHVSQLSHKFVKDPHEAVKAGDVVKVRVLEIDQARNRIALSMRLDEAGARAEDGESRSPRRERGAGAKGRNDRAGHAPPSTKDGGQARGGRGRDEDRRPDDRRDGGRHDGGRRDDPRRDAERGADAQRGRGRNAPEQMGAMAQAFAALQGLKKR